MGNTDVKMEAMGLAIVLPYHIRAGLHQRIFDDEVEKLLSLEKEIAERIHKPILEVRDAARLEVVIASLRKEFISKSIELSRQVIQVLETKGLALDDLVKEISESSSRFFNTLKTAKLGSSEQVRLRFAWLTFVCFESTASRMLETYQHDGSLNTKSLDSLTVKDSPEDTAMFETICFMLLLSVTLRSLSSSRRIAPSMKLIINRLFRAAVAILDQFEREGYKLDPLEGLPVSDRAEVILSLSREVYGGLTTEELERTKPVQLFRRVCWRSFMRLNLSIPFLVALVILFSACKEDSGPGADDGLPDSDVPDLAPDDSFQDLETADPDAPSDPQLDEAPLDMPEDPDAADAPEDGVTWEVLPYDGCVSGDPRAKFIAETALPDTVMTYEEHTVSLTFANCSGETWTYPDFKVGSQAPQDNMVWNTNRLLLPADVQPNEMFVVEFQIVITDLIGSYGYQWGVVHEGVEWLYDELSPLHTITVASPVSTVELCTDVLAELGGRTSATAQLQQCIDETPEGGLLEIPAGVYLMTGAVTISRSIILRTAGTADHAAPCHWPGALPCAVLFADANLDVDNGFFQILDSSSNVTVEHIVLDGNRQNRLGSSAAATCASGNNRKGFNSFVRGSGHRLLYNASVRTLCGTGMELRSDGVTIMGNFFDMNGDHTTTNLWADGLTIHEASDSTITGNYFYNNSDVALILGGGTNTTVSGNLVSQTTQLVFAGIMLDNFNGGTSGDFTGTLVTGNTVFCNAHLCDFGINLGPHAWYLSDNTIGGSVYGNTVFDGKICLNIDGAGTTASPVLVFGNILSGSPSSAEFMCGVRATSNYNIGPDSVVDHDGDITATYTTYEWHQCP
jgi:parallel beta-helix repeat protein